MTACWRVHGKAEWKFALTMLGEPSVIMYFVLLMQQWHVDSWDCQTRVSSNNCIVKSKVVGAVW